MALHEAKNFYTTAYKTWALELSHDKNVTIAKDIASYICTQLMKASFESPGLYDDYKKTMELIQNLNHNELYDNRID